MPRSQRKISPKVCSLDSENDKWVVVSLSSNGEKENDIEAIKRAARRILRNQALDVYVPAVSQTVRGESETMFYMQGYVFIRYAESVPYLRLRETPYFTDVLCSYINRKLRYNLLNGSELKKIQDGVDNLRFSKFETGNEITIIKGNFKNLPGVVSCVYSEETIQVSIVLRSKRLLMDFPSTYLAKRRVV